MWFDNLTLKQKILITLGIIIVLSVAIAIPLIVTEKTKKDSAVYSRTTIPVTTLPKVDSDYYYGGF
jgi:hypothetical protein